MLWHLKSQMWLPPGGHIEPNELPDEAAIREVVEETGVTCRLVGDRALPLHEPLQLIRPEGIQLEDITPGHQHIDLIYFAEAMEGEITASPGVERAAWYALDEMEVLGANEEIRTWSARAVAKMRAVREG